jgi:hypothetical protein
MNPGIIRKSEVLTASVASFSFTMLGTLLMLVGTILSKVRGGELVSILVGSDASLSLLRSSEENILTSVDRALSNNLLGRSVVFVVWMFVGLVVFAVISGIQRGITDVREIETELESANVDKPKFIHTLLRDVSFRIGIAVGWALFTLLCLQLIMPFFVASVFTLFGLSVSLVDIVLALAGTTTVFLCLHAHVILARLFAGRVRLFGL